jgi:tetratricopeptide (TPR) repeat protein
VQGGDDATAAQAAREEIEQLVDAVHCHARTLALLAPALRERGVAATRESLVALMVEMEKEFPGSREQSVFASVELSLRRLTEPNRERARALAVFHGGVNFKVLRVTMKWEESAVVSLMGELLATGLATQDRNGYLTLNPALCPYLRGRMDAAERESLTRRWVEAMRPYVQFLLQQQGLGAEVAVSLTVSELPNLFALLDLVVAGGEAEAIIELATSLSRLLQRFGKPRLLARVGQVRDAAVRILGETWSHAAFEAAATGIEQQLVGGLLREALKGAQQLLQRARTSGERAYPSADYDLASACCLLARTLQTIGSAEEALLLLDEARERFEAIEQLRQSGAAAGMASVCLTEQGNCFRDLGRLAEAAVAYEQAIRRGEDRGDKRSVAVGKVQLQSVRRQQGRYAEPLKAYTEARERFTQLNEPLSVAAVWHQRGMAYHEAGDLDAAEHAYRRSLEIKVALGDIAGQGNTLNQLGGLYDQVLNRPEEAAAFYRHAVDKYVESGNVGREGGTRYNLATVFLKLSQFDEARREVRRAIECDAQFGHASKPWKAWATLAEIEMHTGNSVGVVEAKQKALACYLAYRLDGGENHADPGRIAFAVTKFLVAGQLPEAASFLREMAARPGATGPFEPFLRALQAIVAGSRDRALADAPDLNYMMAAEILFLIEILDKPQQSPEAQSGHE